MQYSEMGKCASMRLMRDAWKSWNVLAGIMDEGQLTVTVRMLGRQWGLKIDQKWRCVADFDGKRIGSELGTRSGSISVQDAVRLL